MRAIGGGTGGYKGQEVNKENAAQATATTAGRQVTTPVADALYENINDHLNKMNSGGGTTNKPEVEAGDDGDQDNGTTLPAKKKKKLSRTDKRKEKKSAWKK